MWVVARSSCSCIAKMAEVSRGVRREAGRLVALVKGSNRVSCGIDGKLSVGPIPGGNFHNGTRKACTRNAAQLGDNEWTRGDCRKWQPSQPNGVTPESFKDSRNCTVRGTLVEEKYTCMYKPEGYAISLNRGLSQMSRFGRRVSLEVSAKSRGLFTPDIPHRSDCQIGVVDCKCDLYDWFGTGDQSKAESQCTKDCSHLLSHVCAHKHVHEIRSLKKNAFLARVTNLTNRQQRRGFCTLLHEPAVRWNCFIQAGCCGALSFARAYGTSAAPPLYRSRSAYYDILRVSPNASQAQIKTAYYKQSFVYHPDRNSGSEEAALRFSEISEAYSVLGSIALRRKYDRGILSHTDVQSAGRPSSRETRSSSPAGQQQQRKPLYTHTGPKPEKIFDFDAFYQAHYGQQLQRERELRELKEKLREKRLRENEALNSKRMMELSMIMILALSICIFAYM